MNYIELSHCLKNNFPIYPGDPNFSIKHINQDEEFYITKLEANFHTGTHIDSPLHYIENGKTVDKIPLNQLIGTADIFKLKNNETHNLENNKNKYLKNTSNHYLKNNENDYLKNNEFNYLKNKEIKVKDIENINLQKTNNKNKKSGLEKIIILDTNWHNYFNRNEYFYKNPYLSKEFTKYLIENEINTIAIDTCSVDKYGNSKIHKLLLKNEINIIENLTNTNKLTENKYKAYFIPMKINAEASFVRAFVEFE